MLKIIKQTKHLCPALLLLHGQDYCLWAGGHTFFWLFEGWSQTHVTADEANHVVNKSVNAQCATQVQVWLLIRLCWAVTPLAAQFGPEPRLSQGVWGAVKQACRQEERGRSLSYMLFCGSMDHVSLAPYSSAMSYFSTVNLKHDQNANSSCTNKPLSAMMDSSYRAHWVHQTHCGQNSVAGKWKSKQDQ